MMNHKSFSTEQETFWAGEFGDDYIGRNRGKEKVASNMMFFSKILPRCGQINSVIEFGANVGLNLLALRQLLPSAELAGVEINAKAAEELRSIQGVHVHQISILDFTATRKYDLALIKGVLIHVAPDRLPDVYECLYHATNRYILLAEYYNPVPIEVPYRGHRERLFKRDFAGEMLDRFPHLRLLDYGFVYHRDSFPQDDITWFLLEKQDK